MTPAEFKVWLDGFSEGIDKAPTEKQWARVREQMGNVREMLLKPYERSGTPIYHVGAMPPEPGCRPKA